MFCPLFTYFIILSLSTRLIKLLRFKLNQITRKRSGRTKLTTLLRWEIFILPTRKPWLNQAYHASDVEIVNQISQKTLVKPGLPGFWGGKFQPGLPGKPGNTRLTKHFWLRFLSRDLSYQTFMVNYNQAYLESLVKPGSTRLSVLVDNNIVKSLVSLVQPGFTRLTRLLTRLLVQGRAFWTISFTPLKLLSPYILFGFTFLIIFQNKEYLREKIKNTEDWGIPSRNHRS